ncbi:hypothetical protein ACFPH6_22910 [Streptomyces xiangluensis]|uniref:Uncharacterized protein n=1 Tax=Streptomyces xiangluensis TaxID=2665720 RepID=A0ABV8YTY9_9ACTN
MYRFVAASLPPHTVNISAELPAASVEPYVQPVCTALRAPSLGPVSRGLLVRSASVERVDAEVADTARERAVVVSHDHADVSHSGPGVRDLGDGPVADPGAYVLEHVLRRSRTWPGRPVRGV